MIKDFSAGKWRDLYISFIRHLSVTSVLEAGCGDPSFLKSLPSKVTRRVGLDGNTQLETAYENAGIEFHVMDLDKTINLQEIGSFDVCVCSDVFEHLVNPQNLLRSLRSVLFDGGIMFSHVPNEYRTNNVIKIMLGKRETVYRTTSKEWTEGHIRRFSDIGFREFLNLEFLYNVKISEIYYEGVARLLHNVCLPVPFCIQGGPTYASTNNKEMYESLVEIKGRISRG